MRLKKVCEQNKENKENEENEIMEYNLSKEDKEYLKVYDPDKYKKPSVVTDIAVFTIGEEQTDNIRLLPEKKLRLLLIKRTGPLFAEKWALPGGFCQPDEEVDVAARRELYEETNVKDAYLSLSGIYGEKGRDPRDWTISNAYLALVLEGKCNIQADTDAKDVRWFDIDVNVLDEEKSQKDGKICITKSYELLLSHTNAVSDKQADNQTENQTDNQTGNQTDNQTGCKKTGQDSIIIRAVVREEKIYENYHEKITRTIVETDEQLAFDHAKIIMDAFIKLQQSAEHDEKIIFDLMPEKFTLTELQTVFEIVLQKELVKPNFRRKIADYVVETEEVTSGRGHRQAKLYTRNVEHFYTM